MRVFKRVFSSKRRKGAHEEGLPVAEGADGDDGGNGGLGAGAGSAGRSASAGAKANGRASLFKDGRTSIDGGSSERAPESTQSGSATPEQGASSSPLGASQPARGLPGYGRRAPPQAPSSAIGAPPGISQAPSRLRREEKGVATSLMMDEPSISEVSRRDSLSETSGDACVVRSSSLIEVAGPSASEMGHRILSRALSGAALSRPPLPPRPVATRGGGPSVGDDMETAEHEQDESSEESAESASDADGEEQALLERHSNWVVDASDRDLSKLFSLLSGDILRRALVALVSDSSTTVSELKRIAEAQERVATSEESSAQSADGENPARVMEENKRLRDELARAQSQAVEGVAAEVGRLKQESVRLEQHLAQSREETKRFEQSHRELSQRHEHALAEQKRLAQQTDELRKRLQEQQTGSDAKSEVQQHEARYQELRSRYEQAARRQEELQLLCDQLRAQIEKLSAQREKCEGTDQRQQHFLSPRARLSAAAAPPPGKSAAPPNRGLPNKATAGARTVPSRTLPRKLSEPDRSSSSAAQARSGGFSPTESVCSDHSSVASGGRSSCTAMMSPAARGDSRSAEPQAVDPETAEALAMMDDPDFDSEEDAPHVTRQGSGGGADEAPELVAADAVSAGTYSEAEEDDEDTWSDIEIDEAKLIPLPAPRITMDNVTMNRDAKTGMITFTPLPDRIMKKFRRMSFMARLRVKEKHRLQAKRDSQSKLLPTSEGNGPDGDNENENTGDQDETETASAQGDYLGENKNHSEKSGEQRPEISRSRTMPSMQRQPVLSMRVHKAMLSAQKRVGQRGGTIKVGKQLAKQQAEERQRTLKERQSKVNKINEDAKKLLKEERQRKLRNEQRRLDKERREREYREMPVVYVSEVSGNWDVRKQQEQIKFLFTARRIKFRTVDVSLDENRELRDRIFEVSGTRQLPQVWVKGHYKGGFDEMEMANEAGLLKTYLLFDEGQIPEGAMEASEQTSA